MSDPSEMEKIVMQNARIKRLVALTPLLQRDKARLMMQHEETRTQFLHQLIRRAQGIRKRGVWICTILLLLCVGIVSACNAALLFNFILGIGVPLICFVPALIYRPRSLEKAARDLLYQTKEGRTISMLLDRLPSPSRAQRAKTQESLKSLLPGLIPEDFRRLSLKQRTALYELLNADPREADPGLQSAAIATLRLVKDPDCLGALYLLASRPATSQATHAVKREASAYLTYLRFHHDWGSPDALPQHLGALLTQMRDIAPNLNVYFTSLLTIRQLLPLATSADYRDLLPTKLRHSLYALVRQLVHSPFFTTDTLCADRRDLQLEIIRTAERQGDTEAIREFRAYLHYIRPSSDEQVHAAVCRALGILEPLAEQARMGRTLLRGAAAPSPSSTELLRAAAPGASSVVPSELLRSTSVPGEQPPVNPMGHTVERDTTPLRKMEDVSPPLEVGKRTQ